MVEAADADSWGADIFRRLLAYLGTVRVDLESLLATGDLAPGTLDHLSQLGAELELQRWAELWPSHHEYTEALAVTLRAVEECHGLLRARAGVAPAT